MELDHLVVAATDLAAGAEAVAARLGVAPGPGGAHAAMATHNRLLRLGDVYLEVIAPDPSAPRPGRPRWFDLDRFAGPPRLTNWVVRCADLPAALAAGPAGWGTPAAFARGDLRWQMAVPEDGVLPFGGLAPALISWQGRTAVEALPDSGLRLRRLRVSLPRADALRSALAGFADPRVEIAEGAPGLSAEIETAEGTRQL